MELRYYNYSPKNSLQERRLSIELALMENSVEDVLQQLNKIQKYHPNVVLDISEIH